MAGLKCMNRGCGKYIRIPHVSEPSTPMYFKYKDKTCMTQINVCKSCWEKARSLKVIPIEHMK